ncbi:MAG: response regulator transcription factor, partial [Ramlibacter sp.]
FSADLARSGEEAMEKLKARPYRFVFLDASLEGMDGYQTCKAIKQRRYADGKPPVVVMLNARAGAVDKVLGSMAGCDEYMAKPLEEGPLLKLLAKYDDQVQRGFQATNLGTEMDKPPRKR